MKIMETPVIQIQVTPLFNSDELMSTVSSKLEIKNNFSPLKHESETVVENMHEITKMT